MTSPTGTHSRRSPGLLLATFITRLSAASATTSQMSQCGSADSPQVDEPGRGGHDQPEEPQHDGLQQRQETQGRREPTREAAAHGVGTPRRAEREGDLEADHEQGAGEIGQCGQSGDIHVGPLVPGLCPYPVQRSAAAIGWLSDAARDATARRPRCCRHRSGADGPLWRGPPGETMHPIS